MEFLTVPNLVVALAALGAFVSVVAIGLPLIQRDALTTRMKAVTEKRRELSTRQQESFRKPRFQAKRHVGLMRAVLGRLRLQNLLESKDLKRKLSQAGWRRPSAPVTFVFSRIALPILTLGAAILYVTGPFEHLALPMKIMICGLGAAIGVYLPNLLLTNAVQKRQMVLTRSFPDALDLMVICVEAGLSVEAAFLKVTEEMAESAPEMAEEIGLTAAELAFLGDRRQAFDNLSDRTGLGAMKSLATALIQSEKYGTPVSLGLRVLSQEQRDTRLSAAEKKAAALPAKLTVPMIIFFLPVLFLVIAGPAGIQVSGMMK